MQLSIPRYATLRAGIPAPVFSWCHAAPAVPVLRVLGQRPNMQKGSGYIPPPCLRNCKPLAGYIACPVYEGMRPLPAGASMPAPVSLFQNPIKMDSHAPRSCPPCPSIFQRNAGSVPDRQRARASMLIDQKCRPPMSAHACRSPEL